MKVRILAPTSGRLQPSAVPKDAINRPNRQKWITPRTSQFTAKRRNCPEWKLRRSGKHQELYEPLSLVQSSGTGTMDGGDIARLWISNTHALELPRRLSQIRSGFRLIPVQVKWPRCHSEARSRMSSIRMGMKSHRSTPTLIEFHVPVQF